MSKTLDGLVEQFSALPIFPTMIWASQVRADLAGRINEAFMRHIDAARTRQPELRAEGKWQTDQHLHTLPDVEEFRQLVDTAVRGILDGERLKYKSIRITGCWANIGFPGSQHRPHTHPNNFLSGVYYVKVAQGGHTINFHDPRPQAGVIFPPSDELTQFTAQKVTLDVRPGTLFLFPAWLNHSVDVNASTTERISVAFNVMFPEFVDAMSPPQWGGNLRVTGVE